MNVLLAISLIIILGLGFYGGRIGFVKTVVPIISGIISLVVFFLLKDWVLGFLFRWAVFQGEHILARIVVILIICFLGTLAFKWIIGVLNLLTKLPLVHGLNKFLGFLLGIAEGFLAVWLILYLARVNEGTLFGLNLFASIESEPFLCFLYKHNLIEHLMTALFGGWIA